MPGTNRSPPERRPERPVIQRKPGPSRPPGTAPGRRKTRFLAGGFTVIVHLLILAALFLPRASTPRSQVQPTSEPIQVSLIDTPKPPPPGPPDVTMVQPEAAPAPVLPNLTVRVHAPSPMAASDTSDLLSASQLAGAAAVGEGGGGGGGSCDLARAVQQALRRDPMVRSAVEEANRSGKAIMLWNGDWVRSGGQDGKGLSAARETVMWEVGFAPEACRHQQMHGLLLLSLADGSTRFAIGTGDWRWSDLLGVRGAAANR
jgi:hypothetical protein